MFRNRARQGCGGEHAGRRPHLRRDDLGDDDQRGMAGPAVGTVSATEVLDKVREAMADGARLDVVRLFFNPTHKWGVHVYAHSTTPTGRDKWTKVILILPNDGETVADVLSMLGTMAEESS